MLTEHDGLLLLHSHLLEPELITPLTALTVDAAGRLTYMGQDGIRRVIVGDPDLLERLLQSEQISDEQHGSPGS
ncbi:hypothetical protein SynBIOSU31_02164 [Synechococcus sp. BIOS-U3-1]|uniref:hypothetical protein n=1 Tax=Synechococcus sp. BIOS-U3-1 TaxID=1400865 RepID=UPI001861D8CC|nr:hypothetical protein [Synechococcus sp. BIOS-U3-1]QNI59030.1 hypothetical protein SynBIOSU31_02164 [Synechococcus sp. BIOS-U3-1]